MTTLILHTRPDRLARLAARLTNAGQECHLANTSVQAQLMCHSERYSALYIDRDILQGGDFEVPQLAISRNPRCRIVTVEPADFAAKPDNGQAMQVPRAKAAPTWRRIGTVVAQAQGNGAGDAAGVVRQEGSVRWRLMRAQGRFSPGSPPVADDASTEKVSAIRCVSFAQVPRLAASLPGASQALQARAETRV